VTTQSRRQSLVETFTGTGIGMVGSWLIAYSTYVLITDKVVAVTITTAACTVWSLVRGYCVRRYFARR